MKTRHAFKAIIAALLVTVLHTGAFAQDATSDDTATAAAAPVQLRYPAPFNDLNPFTKKVQVTREQVQAAVKKFYADYYAQPWNFYLQVANYYRYVDAYNAYMQALAAYWRWENNNRNAFTGKVVSQSYPWIRPLAASGAAPEPATTDDTPTSSDPAIAIRILPQEIPIPGAAITLMPAMIFLKSADGDPSQNPVAVNQGVDPGQSVDAIPPDQDQKIAASYPGWQIYRQKSTPRGTFAFRNVRQGSYRFTVSAEGYQVQSGTVEIGGGPVRRTIVMNKEQIFTGTVVTIAPRAVPIILPLLRASGSTGTGVVDPATTATGAPEPSLSTDQSDAVERALVASPNLPPEFRRFIPLSGATVRMQRSDIAYIQANGGTVDAPQADNSSAGVARPDIWPGPMPGQTTTTDGNGRFSFKGLDGNQYWINVSKPGYMSFGANITIFGGTQQRRIVLIPTFKDIPPLPMPMAADRTTVDQVSGDDMDNPFADQ